MKKALVIGGSNGIGLAIATCLARDYDVTIVDKVAPEATVLEWASFEQFDLLDSDYSVFDKYSDVDVLMITAGIGHLALFQDIDEEQIPVYINVNTISVLRIVKRFYHRLQGERDFFCGVMGSIAGFMSSPFLSVYGASKAALKIFIESVNVELEKKGCHNRILNVSPGSIQGTHFNGGMVNDLDLTLPLAHDIIEHLLKKDDLFIPKYDEVYAGVLERYHQDFRAEGRHSYDYKVQSGRIKKNKNK